MTNKIQEMFTRIKARVLTPFLEIANQSVDMASPLALLVGVGLLVYVIRLLLCGSGFDPGKRTAPVARVVSQDKVKRFM